MTSAPAAWYEVKTFLAQTSGLSMDGLHIIGGVLIQLLAAALLRCSVAQWRPWLVVFVLQLANEGYDLWVERWPSLALQLSEGVLDCAATIALPTLLLVVARTRPELLGARR